MSNVAAPALLAGASNAANTTGIVAPVAINPSISSPGGWSFAGSASVGDTTVGGNPVGWTVAVWDQTTRQFLKSAIINAGGYWSVTGIAAGLSCVAVAYSPTNEHPPLVHVGVVSA